MRTLLALILGPPACPDCGTRSRWDLYRDQDFGRCISCAYRIWREQYGPIR